MDVRVSETARDAYANVGPHTAFADGSLFAAFHRDVQTGLPGPVYVIERRDGTWRYMAFDPDGRPAEHGSLALCERCHAESPSGALFGVSR